jgi:predicted DNA-binding transcriptional regulator AlpA
MTPITALEHAIEEAPLAEIPALIGVLATLQAKAQIKLLHRESEPSRQEDRLLTVTEASDKLGTTKDYLYRHADILPFSVRMGPKQLRFSLNGIERYIKLRRARHNSRIDINT